MSEKYETRDAKDEDKYNCTAADASDLCRSKLPTMPGCSHGDRRHLRCCHY